MRNLLRLAVGGLCLAAVLAGSATPFVGGASAGGAIPGRYIVVLKDGADQSAAEDAANRAGARLFLRYSHALHGYAASMSDAALAKVKADSRVLAVWPDEEMMLSGTADCVPIEQWVPGGPQPCQALGNGINRIDGDVSSTRSGDGRGSVPVNVAVLDSGIDVDHPDLNVVRTALAAATTTTIPRSPTRASSRDMGRSWPDSSVQSTTPSGALA